MSLKRSLLAVACLGVATAVPAARAQSCTASQDAAVQCFVANAVKASLIKPHFGMTLAQLESYGVAVSHILQTHDTYLTLIGTASAIADAMPPTNADGSANQEAQDVAVMQIVSAEVNNGLAKTVSGVAVQHLWWFSLDVVDAMNDNNGYLQLFTPGISLRIADSYVVSATSNGTVNWPQAYSGISGAIDQMIGTGLMKPPPNMSAAQIKSFSRSLAKVIYQYRVATKRAHL
jgi:hypothetical protein